MTRRYEPPEPGPKDRAYSLVKGAVSAVPLAGGAVAEIFGILIASPLEERRDAWMRSVAHAIRRLESLNETSLDRLAANEAFVSVLVHATQAAIRAHDREKRSLLRYAVIASARGTSIAADLQLQFVRFLDELTPTHVHLLRFLRDNEAEVGAMREYEAIFAAFSGECSSSMSRDHFRMLVSDLQTRVLIRVSASMAEFDDVHDEEILVTENVSTLPFLRVTDIGAQLLAMVGREPPFDE